MEEKGRKKEISGRPSKPIEMIVKEGKSHKTKAELEMRAVAEQALLSGVEMQEAEEVKGNAVAHATFKRVAELLQSIGKSDGLYENAVNRYAMITAEVENLQEKKRKLEAKIALLESSIEPEAVAQSANLQKLWLSYDRQILAMRKEMTALEREHMMTAASALRNIPKKPVEDKTPDSNKFGRFEVG